MKEPKIVEVDSRRLLGMRILTTLAEDLTIPLWKQFKARVHEVSNRKNSTFFSVQKFKAGISYEQFTPFTKFEKWAAVEIEEDEGMLPPGLEPLLLSGGSYAVFIHEGEASKFNSTLQHIFGQWLPASKYILDQRAHFEIMFEGYDPNDANASEEVWIPIKEKVL